MTRWWRKTRGGDGHTSIAVRWAHQAGTMAQQHAIGDLIVITIYYLLQVGEYTTKTKRRGQTRTRQFRVKDVTFFRRNEDGDLVIVPASASDDKIQRASAATLRISNQKNGHLGACVHQEEIVGEQWACHLRALARRVLHICRHTSERNTLLCAYWDDVGCGNVTDGLVRVLLKFAANYLAYPRRGIPLQRIDTHLLQSGGACALAQAGYSDRDTQKMGRWAPNSQAFKEYIQQQLSTFSQGMAQPMSEVPRFTNMEGTSKAGNLRHTTVH